MDVGLWRGVAVMPDPPTKAEILDAMDTINAATPEEAHLASTIALAVLAVEDSEADDAVDNETDDGD